MGCINTRDVCRKQIFDYNRLIIILLITAVHIIVDYKMMYKGMALHESTCINIERPDIENEYFNALREV